MPRNLTMGASLTDVQTRQPTRRRRRFLPVAEQVERRDLLAAFQAIPIPSPNAQPLGITSAADGTIWFTESGTARIGYISPGTSSIQEIFTSENPTDLTIGSGNSLWLTFQSTNRVFRNGDAPLNINVAGTAERPSQLVTLPDGTAWYIQQPSDQQTSNTVGKITPGNPTPTVGAVNLPNSANAQGILAGSDGSIWVTAFNTTNQIDQLLRIDPLRNPTSATATATFGAGSRPSSIAQAADGSIYVALAGANAIARGDASGTNFTTYSVNAAPGALAVDASGNLWFTEQNSSRVGRLSPAGQVTHFTTTQGIGVLTNITASPGGLLWFTSKNDNQIVRLDPQQLIAVTPQNVSANLGTNAQAVVATFTTQAAGPSPGDFTATIQWGDGVTSPATIRAGENNTFEVLATLPFQLPGSFRVVVSDNAGISAVVNGTVTGGPPFFTGGLADFSDSGTPGDGITNVSRPTFLGQATAYSIVQLYATAAGSWPTQSRLIGQTIANANGQWSLTSEFLNDGAYTITGAITPPGGSPGQPLVLTNTLVIDTVGPRVAGLDFSPVNGAITTVLSDVGSGIDESSATNPESYIVIPPRSIAGRNPAQQIVRSPAISGFYSTAGAYTVQISFNGSGKGPLARGRYTFQITSGGVKDLAGNPLDGEFTGRLPSGNGVPGGNFLAQLTNSQPTANQRRAPAGRFARRR